jgi:ribosomal protein S13
MDINEFAERIYKEVHQDIRHRTKKIALEELKKIRQAVDDQFTAIQEELESET